MLPLSFLAALTAALVQVPQTKPLRAENFPHPFAIINDPVPRVGRKSNFIRERHSRLKKHKRKDVKRKK